MASELTLFNLATKTASVMVTIFTSIMANNNPMLKLLKLQLLYMLWGEGGGGGLRGPLGCSLQDVEFTHSVRPYFSSAPRVKMN